jgi:hypothetical protein
LARSLIGSAEALLKTAGMQRKNYGNLQIQNFKVTKAFPFL